MLQPKQNKSLTDQDIRDYFETGWITRRALFDSEEVARIGACFDGLEKIAGELTRTGMHRGSYFVLAQRNGARVIERVVWAGGCEPYLLEIGSDSRLTMPCAELLRSRTIDHLLNQAHFKHPNDGVVFDWHQDIEHRDKGDGTWTDINGRGSFVQTLIVVDEMTPDSGPLLFVPGSSSWGRGGFRGADRLESCASDAVTIAAEPGDTLFFGPYTVHASFENTSSRSRRVLINGYASPGANRRIYPGAGVGRRLSHLER